VLLFNEDCIKGAKRIPDESVHCMICDQPFGITESKFDQMYNRVKINVISGYIEAPDDYFDFTLNWMTEATRILKPKGTMYVVSGWSNLLEVLQATKACGLYVLNQIIWRYNFGVNTKKKFVTSHYVILRLAKCDDPDFYTHCRFAPQEKDSNGGSLLYRDLEDVWAINRENRRGEMKNQNKLPDELVRKLIQYATKEGDTVCDFFMGNFTTAYCAIGLNRKVIGFEINPNAFNYHVPRLKKLKKGYMLADCRKPNVILPANQGKRFSLAEKDEVKRYYQQHKGQKSKKAIVEDLANRYGRGKFSIGKLIA
jgi:site-specific DNA-methyltransferase (adenine-specific)